MALSGCGGVVDAGGGPPPNRAGTSGIGGSGGLGGSGVIGGSGAIDPPAGGGSGGSTEPCSAHCPTYQYAGIIDVHACCTVQLGSCGSVVDGPLAQILSLYPRCYEQQSSGALDPNCPAWVRVDPIAGTPKTHAGCCRPNGTCGVVIDLSESQGPNLGCTDISETLGQVPPQCGQSGDCTTCVLSNCSQVVNACLADSNCATILTCAQSCVTKECVDTCKHTVSTEPPLWQGLESCVQANCPGVCPI